MWHSVQLCENTLSIFVVIGYIYFPFISYCCHNIEVIFGNVPFEVTGVVQVTYYSLPSSVVVRRPLQF